MATKTKALIKIPFDPLSGDQQHYPQERYTGSVYKDGFQNHPVIWKDNYEFETVLCLDDYERGRSAAFFHLTENETGTRYTMFLTDLMRVIAEVGIQPGGIIPYSAWTFCKRGQNYGVTLA